MKLKDLREKLGITRRQLAEMADVPYATVAGIESGTFRPANYEMMLRIAAVLHVTPFEIDEFRAQFEAAKQWTEKAQQLPSVVVSDGEMG